MQICGQQRAGTHKFFDMHTNHPFIDLTAEVYDFYIAGRGGLDKPPWQGYQYCSYQSSKVLKELHLPFR